MTEYAYDPQTPYVVASTVSRNVIARFSYLTHARDFQADDWEVIDTTPKPKIPEDAQFIYWTRGPQTVEYYARRVGHPGNKVWRNDEGEQVDEEELLIDIGDAEVTVLVPKEQA